MNNHLPDPEKKIQLNIKLRECVIYSGHLMIVMEDLEDGD